MVNSVDPDQTAPLGAVCICTDRMANSVDPDQTAPLGMFNMNILSQYHLFFFFFLENMKGC